jgi:hypothetical protein
MTWWMSMPSLRPLLAAALVATSALSAVSSADTSSASLCSGSRDAGHGWVASSPPFPVGPSAVTLVATVRFQPLRLLASNGSYLMVSNDDGCSWQATGQPIGSLGGVVPVENGTRITAVVAPSSATSSRFVYVAAQTGVGGIGQPFVFHSQDGGRTFAPTRPDSGFPLSGTVEQLTASDYDPYQVYAVVDVAGDRGLYASTDGGENWTRRGRVDSSFALGSLRADPVVANRLYGLGASGVQESDDGGGSFVAGAPQAGDVSSFDLATGHGGVRMVQGHAASPELDLTEGGNVWRRYRAPIDTTHVWMGTLQEVVAVSDGRHLVLEAPGLGLHADVTPDVGVPTSLALSAPGPLGIFNAAGVTSGGELLHGTFDPFFRAKPPQLAVRLWRSRAAGTGTPATVLPDGNTVTLPAGHSQTLTYRLTLPREPSPIDVMFLVDTTNSMQGTINELRQDLAAIVDRLSAVGLDVEFGLGDFRDYPPPAGGGVAGDYPYRLDRRIGPADAALAAALSRLTANGGGDEPEAQLAALYQSTTGTGQILQKRYVVLPHRQARYRYGSLRLAVLATDSNFHHNYPAPSWQRTMHALNAQGVESVGLAAGQTALVDLRHAARATGALAPAGGVDCNGDGVVDLAPGAPLVCSVPAPPVADSGAVSVAAAGTSVQGADPVLADAITTIAQNVADPRPVAFGLSGNPYVGRLVSSSVVPGVNLKDDNELSFTVRYACPAAHAALAFPFRLYAAAAGITVATARTTVRCAALPPLPPLRGLPLAAVPPVSKPAAAGGGPPPPAPREEQER